MSCNLYSYIVIMTWRHDLCWMIWWDYYVYDMMSILHVYDMIRILYETCTETSQIRSKKMIWKNIVVALFSAGQEDAAAKGLSSSACKNALLIDLAVALVQKALLLSRYSSSACQNALLINVSCSAVSAARLPALLIHQIPALLLGFSLVVPSINYVLRLMLLWLFYA
jgi:hypothetical protein